MTNVVTIHDGRLSLSRITYHCDLQRASGLKIPLGVIAEITLGSVRALGLIARTELGSDELGAIGGLMRDQLASPFDFLAKEFDWAWTNSAPGDGLAALANRNAESLFFAPATNVMIRRAFKSDPDVMEFVRRDLRERRDADFDLMLAEYRGDWVNLTGDLAKVAA